MELRTAIEEALALALAGRPSEACEFLRSLGKQATKDQGATINLALARVLLAMGDAASISEAKTILREIADEGGNHRVARSTDVSPQRSSGEGRIEDAAQRLQQAVEDYRLHADKDGPRFANLDIFLSKEVDAGHRSGTS